MKFVLSIFLVIFTQQFVFSQGCSSAGFCTMGSLKANQSYSSVHKVKINYIELSHLVANNGLGEVINASTLDASLSVGKRNRLQIRLPYAWVNGNFGQTKGFGDVYLAYSRNLLQKSTYSIDASIGTKFPRFTTALASPEGKPLPMYYSPSLGTYDIILGLSYLSEKWLLGIGYQAPLGKGDTDNFFDPKSWADTPLSEIAKNYDYSVNFKRGQDIMLRLERNFRWGAYNLFVGAMPVYRITSDEVVDEQGLKKEVKDSQGLALTGIMGGSYSLNVHNRIKLFYGHKILARKVNVDGLMKESVATIAYEWRF
ncbi:MAG: hypothetical protein SFU27_14215 [Thermonemataceae bacterium]|nr:hypothetical protein [Thermonemataceae bacterium]